MKQLRLKFKELGYDETKISKEEGYFYDWLLELKEAGYIYAIEMQPQYDLTDSVFMEFDKVITKVHKKTKVKTVSIKPTQYSIMKGMHYTPDFNVLWHEKALDKFAIIGGSKLTANFNETRRRMFLGERLLIDDTEDGIPVSTIFTCIEIKGTFASRQNSTAVKFPLLQKLTYLLHKIYVNKCMPFEKTKGLFANTFTPKSYWLTEKTLKERALGWTRLSSEQYLDLLN